MSNYSIKRKACENESADFNSSLKKSGWNRQDTWHTERRMEHITGFCGEAQRKELLGRLKHRWEDNMRILKKEDGRELFGIIWQGTVDM